MQQIKVSLDKASKLLKEADVLLFRHPNFPSPGWWVAKYGGTPYSHTGLVHWCHGNLNCLEFKEFIGSRNLPISYYVNKGVEIDVYRVDTKIVYPQLVKYKVYPKYTEYKLIEDEFSFTKDIAEKITDTAEKLVGKPYSWKIIHKIARTFIPFIRFFINKNVDEILVDDNFVCSTLVAYCYRKHFIDLCPFISDNYTQPSDLARSAHLNYILTLTK